MAGIHIQRLAPDGVVHVVGDPGIEALGPDMEGRGEGVVEITGR